MGKNVLVLGIALLLLLGGVTSAPTTSSPAKIVSGVFSNAVSASMKWLWSLKATTKTAITGRPMMKFEGGYTVETVFDGSKLGVEPHTVEIFPSGELLILDSANSNLYRMSNSRPRLVAGSPEGHPGHVDGKLREARMNHPKGLAVDDRGNIYIADTMNMAIRKISDAGVTTIAGGKLTRGGGHVDGPSEDAKFSNDFDVVYVGSSCSLLVIDRGNRAIREIQLHFDDCAYQYGSGFPLGIAVLVAAGFFGYMLALLQRRVGTIVSTQKDQDSVKVDAAVSSPYQKPLKSVRPPLIPTEDEQEKHEEGFFGSLGKLFVNGGVSALEIFRSVLPGFRKEPPNYQYQSQHQQQLKHTMPWAAQESFVIPDEDDPPPIDTRTPTPRKTYPFMSKDADKLHQLRQSRAFYNGWDVDMQQQQQQKQHHHHHRHQTSTPHTVYEQSHEKTNEIIFGAVQDQEGKREAVVIRPIDYGDKTYYHQNFQFRSNLGYNGGY
ncbi:NHL repeat-containing 2 [Gossypium arboreum]|uniref:NHL repeat-containing 2 n=1 Tax=Gossypium arboreum TaxID=29729 RepID=A0A0B0NJF6_GOSAR|nr:NHL repeat-containing 2 [Gossypium arboreum]